MKKKCSTCADTKCSARGLPAAKGETMDCWKDALSDEKKGKIEATVK